MPESKEIRDFLKAYDFKGMAEAFHKGNLRWHEKEWKEFIQAVQSQYAASLREKVGLLKRKRYSNKDFLAHRDEDNKIFNEALSEVLKLLEK